MILYIQLVLPSLLLVLVRADSSERPLRVEGFSKCFPPLRFQWEGFPDLRKLDEDPRRNRIDFLQFDLTKKLPLLRQSGDSRMLSSLFDALARNLTCDGRHGREGKIWNIPR